MNSFVIKDFELGITVTAKAQGVAEVMFDYLPGPSFNATITFRNSKGWVVIDSNTDFKYEVTAV